MNQETQGTAPQAAVARRAYELVFAVKGSARDQKHYATLARRLPAMLQRNGLGQTLAFLYAKGDGGRGDGAEAWLLKHLAELAGLLEANAGPSRDVMQAVVLMTPDGYRYAGRRAASAAVWLKRFAEGRFGTFAEEGD